MFFLKKEGNASVHSSVVKKDAIVALECLQRAFEAAVNYALAKDKTNTNLIRLAFDEELLILGTKKKKTLQEKYLEEKAKTELFKIKKPERKSEARKVAPKKNDSKKVKIKQTKNAAPKKSQPRKKLTLQKSKRSKTTKIKQRISFFWKIMIFMAIAGVVAGFFLIS